MLGEAKRTYSQLQKKVVIPGRLACMAVVEHDNGLSGGIGYILYVRHKNDKNNHRDTEARRILNKRFIDCCIKHTPESSLDRGDSGVCLIQQSINRLFNILRASVSL